MTALTKRLTTRLTAPTVSHRLTTTTGPAGTIRQEAARYVWADRCS